MKKIAFIQRCVFAFLVAIAPSYSHAQDLLNIGGDLTSDLPGRSAIQVNAPNVTDESRRILQLQGFGVFHGLFDKKSGLGPIFNNSSCKGCHVDNGRGPARISRSQSVGSTMVVKVSLLGLQKNGAPKNVPGVGEQLLDHAISGSSPNAEIFLKWISEEGAYPDGTKYKLRRPDLKYRLLGQANRRTISSLRMTPPVIGPGLLEAVPDSTILEFSDPKDLDGDGISGHPNYVPDLITGQKRIGRFGFKGSHITVEQQSSAALINDMGISNPILQDSSKQIELSAEQLNILALYQKLAGIPRPIKQDDPNVISGKSLFQSVGCDKCHRVTMTTETYVDPELSNQEFHPFTDLLLHDMGPDLADKRAEFSAKGSEWRTTPLWGIGFSRRLAKGKAVFLHDGRARSIEEAILWHAGEADKSRKQFKKLTRTQRANLLAFLDSL